MRHFIKGADYATEPDKQIYIYERIPSKLMRSRVKDAQALAHHSPAAQIREILTAGLRDRSDVYGALEFGSVARGKTAPNDYDVIIVADHEFVIPRSFYEQLSKITLEIYQATNIRAEMLVRDKAILSTFFSNFGRAFRTHLDDHGSVVFGMDPRPLFTRSFPDSLKGFACSVTDFGVFVEALEWEVNRLSSTRKHATMLELYRFNYDQNSIGKAMSKLKTAELSRNVLLINGIAMKYEDVEGIFASMARLYGTDIADGLRRIELLREREMPPNLRTDLFFDALELRQRIAQKIVSDLQ